MRSVASVCVPVRPVRALTTESHTSMTSSEYYLGQVRIAKS